MGTSRRDFMKASAIALCSTALPASILMARPVGPDAGTSDLFKVPPESQLEAMFQFTADSFAKQLDTEFRVTVPDSIPSVLTLTEVSAIEPSLNDPAVGDCFLLVFEGSRRNPLAQGTFVFENDGLGQFSMFLVPAGLNKKRALYEAVFNRRVPAR